jgi:hypothetical protein
MVLWAGALLFADSALAQGDGPRAYQVVPNGTNVLAVYGLSLRGNQTADTASVIQGGDIDVDLGVVQFTHSFAVAGRQAAAFALLPYGEVSGRLEPPFERVQGSSTGTGDAIVGTVFTLVGSPPLTLQEFVAYDPGYALGVLAKVSAPTGSYDNDKFLNVGANRWALQLGAPHPQPQSCPLGIARWPLHLRRRDQHGRSRQRRHPARLRTRRYGQRCLQPERVGQAQLR